MENKCKLKNLKDLAQEEREMVKTIRNTTDEARKDRKQLKG